MIKTIIADDETHARERLKDLLLTFGIFEIIAEATDGNEALNLMITHNPDVAFLDINMPGMSVFKSVPSLNNPPIIIFQTAYSEYAAEAFDISALDYLLKPIRLERLEKSVLKIKEKLNFTTNDTEKGSKDVVDRISIKINDKIKIIEVSEIIRLSFENGFCYIYTSTDRFISDKYLNYYEEKLKDCGFFRTSRTDMVNIEAISVIQNLHQGIYTIELKNGTTVDLSRRKAQILKKIVDQ